MSASKTSTPDGSKFHVVYENCINEINDSSTQGVDDETGKTGLTNQGNSCYVNCILQSLLNTPKFAFLYILRVLEPHINVNNARGTKGALTGCLSAVADCYWSANYESVNTKPFLKIFSKEVNPDFDGKAEEDAHEFQMLMLDRLSEDVNRVAWPVNFTQDYSHSAQTLKADTTTGYAKDYLAKQRKYSSSVVGDIFRIVTCTSISCPICLLTRTNFEEQNNLSVGLATENGKSDNKECDVNLITCLNRHFEPSTMERSCAKCGKQDSPRSLYIWRLPEILIIHLKRFGFQGGETVKDSRTIDYPVDDLDLKRYLHPASPDLSKGATLYSLYAIVTHTGSADTGHYTARVKNLDRNTDFWQLFDDKERRELKLTDVKSNAAYMLYYARNAMFKALNPEKMCEDEKRQNA